jgi:hypothetical protein
MGIVLNANTLLSFDHTPKIAERSRGQAGIIGPDTLFNGHRVANPRFNAKEGAVLLEQIDTLYCTWDQTDMALRV